MYGMYDLGHLIDCILLLYRLLISGGADVYKLNFPIKCPQKIADTIAYVFVSEQNVGLVSALLEYGVLCLKPEYIGEYLIKVWIVTIIFVF